MNEESVRQIARLYVCPACSAPVHAPAAGGSVACSRCSAPHTLPDRTSLPRNPNPQPNNDAQHLAQLRAQDGRTRSTPATLQAILGGPLVQAGREQEAIAIWQSLRVRSAAGDALASEDMTALAFLLVQTSIAQANPELLQAVTESTLDAAVLPRHKQEQLGRLVRRAAVAGDRARAAVYLAWMAPSPTEIEADSEVRLGCAVLATLDRDPARVLACLAERKDIIPIVDSMDDMASVFRANAFELQGNRDAAMQALRELPDARMLEQFRASYASLNLCTQTGDAYRTAVTAEAAQHAAQVATGSSSLLAGIFTFVGVALVIAGVVVGKAAGFANAGSFMNLGFGTCMVVASVALVVVGRRKAARAAWLRSNGLALGARVADARPTGTIINGVPVYALTLEVAGPNGPYQVVIRRTTREHEVARVLGNTIRVWVNPQKLDDLLVDG